MAKIRLSKLVDAREKLACAKNYALTCDNDEVYHETRDALLWLHDAVEVMLDVIEEHTDTVIDSQEPTA